MARITLRIDLDEAGSIGPGKVRLLELIAELGSIRRAGGKLGMSYARAWGLVRELDQIFGSSVVEAAPGGRSGGGATLTPLGREVIARYRAAERKAATAVRRDVDALRGRLKTRRS